MIHLLGLGNIIHSCSWFVRYSALTVFWPCIINCKSITFMIHLIMCNWKQLQNSSFTHHEQEFLIRGQKLSWLLRILPFLLRMESVSVFHHSSWEQVFYHQRRWPCYGAWHGRISSHICQDASSKIPLILEHAAELKFSYQFWIRS